MDGMTDDKKPAAEAEKPAAGPEPTRSGAMPFERMLKGRKGVLNDAEMEHLLCLALQDPAVIEACKQLADYARAVRTGQIGEDEDRERELDGKIFAEVHRLRVPLYHDFKNDDWVELETQLNKYTAERWLSDLPRYNPAPPPPIKKVEEIGGPPGPEPTRYGDWQFNGKVTDF
jgi:hypothetical protein